MNRQPRRCTRTQAAVTTLIAVACIEIGQPVRTLAQGLIEEVIVTARRREESLQETPIAVSAFDSDTLRAAQITNVGDLTQNVPGLSRREGNKDATLNIRGVSTRAAGVSAEPGVGVYIDSIYIPRNDTQLVDVVKMESVQVLRGPQGTLFGKNTAGGAILLTTKKPGREFEGYAGANVGDLNRLRLNSGVSGAIAGDYLFGGIQFDTRQEDGYREDAVTGIDYGNIDRKTVLGQLRLERDNFVGDLMLFWGEVEEHGAPSNCFFIQQTALGGFSAPGESDTYADVCARSEALVDEEKVLLDRSGLAYEVTNHMAGLTLAWDFDDITFKSITGLLYQDDINTGSNDTDGSSLFTINNRAEVRRQLQANGIDAMAEERTFLSQEFQLIGDAFDGFLDYTVGLFYSSEKIDDTVAGNMIGPGGIIGRAAGDGMVSIFPTSISFRAAEIQNFENTSAAAFGQAILNFSEMWQLTLGGRFTWEEKEAGQDNYISASAPASPVDRATFDTFETFIHDVVPDPDIPTQSDKDDWTEFSPAVTLTMFTPDAWDTDVFGGGMLYASASNGFKAGGFAIFGDEFVPFDPETVLTYELGYKLDFWDNRVRLNGAFYTSEYTDIQINVTRTFPPPSPDLPARTLNGITNAGEATIQGAEVELSVSPLEGLLFNFTASYIDAEYDEFDDLEPQADGSQLVIDRSDEDFAFTPEQTYTFVAQYDWDSPYGRVTPRLSGSYVSSVFIGLDPASAMTPQAYLDSYEIWNFRLLYQPATVEGLEIAAYVNNLDDEAYFGSGTASVQGVGALSLIPGRQRTYGLELYYSW